MKLERIIKELKKVNDKKVYCRLDKEYYGNKQKDLYILDGYISYRGDYTIASYETINNIDNGMTAHEFANSLENSIGELMRGYKGGIFIVDENNPVAIADYGKTGEYIIDIIEEKDKIFLRTLNYEDYYIYNSKLV